MSTFLAGAMPWVIDLGRALLHFVWQGAVIGAVYALVRRRLPGGACEARYNAGVLALALLALAPPVTLWWLHLAATGASDSASSAVALASIATPAAGAAVVRDLSPASRALSWVVAAWSLGVVLLTARALRDCWRLDRLARRCAGVDPALEGLLAGVARRFGMRRPPRIRVSTTVGSPTLIGWIRPVLLLPAAVVLGFPREQIELILAHELGHIRRLDPLVNLAQTVLETLYFYHPVVHWISRDVRHARELCCDHVVLETMAADRCRYARTLTALEELRIENPRLALAATGGVLRERVRRIVAISEPSFATAQSWSGRGVLVAGFAAAGMIAIRIAGSLATPPPPAPIEAFAAAPVPYTAAIALQLFDIVVHPSLGRIAPPPMMAREPLVPATLPAESGTTRGQALPKPAAALDSGVPVASRTVPERAGGADRSLALRSTASSPESIALTAPQPLPAAPAERTAAAAPASATHPSASRTLVHRVDPVWSPDDRWGTHPLRIELAFDVLADGRVRNVEAVAGDRGNEFATAAIAAVRQWRFAPGPEATAVRQTFQFEPSRSGSASGSSACQEVTGTRICRHPGVD